MDTNDNLKTCHDEVIGILVVKDGNGFIRRTKDHQQRFVSIPYYLSNQTAFKRPILFVTESPHVEEFKVGQVYDCLTQELVHARPVNGVTGNNIRQYLIGLLLGIKLTLEDGYYPIIVINALQEQCSLGQDTALYRTRNFIKYWPSRIEYLQKRLQELDPIIAINACTAGDFYLMREGKMTQTKAFSSGRRQDFEQAFSLLLFEEFGYSDAVNSSDDKLVFMGSFDLAGLVMKELYDAYNPRHILLKKSTHPSAWARSNQLPQLRECGTRLRTLFKIN
ncbi:TPA: hypothetical protein ACX6S8_002174 [Photobacterium damselae]|uniref:hypothetical protein n=1 Tax=Photobacterium damselae TaxID=38293 RepID=UPI001594871C|nr:hypothetical protein [Photobacterium damselae]MCG9706522.1 hypothetical protein [Photobacterium damselae]NVH49935.1 hypothetical protein [Photobacterium damselae subsp. damselae]NVO79892.1 hypothetical protein [Photobacterium damselae subsp. damselae]